MTELPTDMTLGWYGGVLEVDRVTWQLNLDAQGVILSVTYRNEGDRKLWGLVVLPGDPPKTFSASRNPKSGSFTFPVPPQFAGIPATDCGFAVWQE